jgi:hypothetical protein
MSETTTKPVHLIKAWRGDPDPQRDADEAPLRDPGVKLALRTMYREAATCETCLAKEASQ